MNKPIGSTLHKNVEMSSIHTDAYQALCITPPAGAEHQLHLSTARDMEKLGLALGFITEAHHNLPIYHHEGEWVAYDEAEQEAYRNLNYWLVREKLLTHLRCLDMVVMPEAGATWKHRNGLEYEVLMISNQYSEKPEYRATVVYRGPNGKVWTKEFGNFIEKMTFVAGPARHACLDDQASAEALQATQYSKGDTYRKFDGTHLTDVWAAGIHVVSPRRRAPKEWGNHIEVFGDSEDDANSLRDLLLTLLVPSHDGEPFARGQWWLEELRGVNLSHPVTKDQYRAVAVALNLADVVLPFAGESKPEGSNLYHGVGCMPATKEGTTLLEKGEVVRTLDPWDEVAVCAYRVQGGDTLHYNLGPALYFGGVGVSLRQFVDLARLHNVEWDKFRDRTAELTPLAPSKAQAVYQCREIGEGGWRECTEEEYTRCTKYPEMDTRITQKPGTCGDAACTMEASHRCITPKPRTE